MQAGTTLYLVVSAQITAELHQLFPGPADHILSAEGMRQTRRLSTRLSDHQIDSVYSSPYEAAFATASLLAARHRRGAVRLPDLVDMDFGEWAGKTTAQVQESDPEGLVAWRFTPHQHRMPGGETLEEVQSRVVAAVEDIVSAEQGRGICVVADAIPVKAAMSHFLNEDLSMFWLTPAQESAALSIITWDEGEHTLALVGSREHLEG
jgi:broad specificity phosphatase PhoE